MNIPFNYNIHTQAWTFIINGRPVSIKTDDFRYKRVADLMLEPDTDERTKALIDIVSSSKTETVVKEVNKLCQSFGDLKFSIDGDTNVVTYKKVELPKVLSDMLVDLWKQGTNDFSHYVMFLDNVLNNHNERARNELYTFLTYKDLCITQRGTFIAYKGVRKDYYSATGNKQTRVLQGTVDSEGHILNKVGETIQVVTEDVDDDCRKACSNGLHVGSWAYASSFSEITLAVEVNPADVVSVPLDCDCQKCRVSKYKVLEVVHNPIETRDAVVDDSTNTATATKNEARAQVGRELEKVLNGNNANDVEAAITAQLSNHDVVVAKNIAAKTNEIILCAAGKGLEAKRVRVGSKLYKNATTINQLRGSVGRKFGYSGSELITIVSKLNYKTVVNGSALGETIVTK